LIDISLLPPLPLIDIDYFISMPLFHSALRGAQRAARRR
jgi:hypothetical protein